ncbi:MAG: TolC family protein [Phycisphaerae bacterium]|nr:TolC family protein [Gemmatimonadaceae bacterium]
MKTCILIAISLLPALALAQSRTNTARSDSAWTTPDTAPAGPTARALMDGYVAEGLARNLLLAQQTLAEKRSGYAVREANGRFLPSIGINARYTEYSGVINIGDFVNPTYQALNQILGEERFPTNINSTLPQRQETKLALTQPVFNAALMGNRERARALNSASGAQRRLAMRQLTADIQLAWLNLASATQVLRSLRATLPVLDENLRVSERLVSNGQTTVDATYRSRAERSELLQQIAEAVQREAAAVSAFNLLRDRDADAPVMIADDSTLLAVTPIALADAVAMAVREREELDAADQGIRVANAERRIAGGAWKPAVTLAADYGVQGDRYQFDRKHDVATASLIVSWNAFNGGQDAARRAQATIARDEAALQRRAVEQRIRVQVAVAHDALLAARTSLVAASDRLESARRSFTLVERRYAEGLAPPVDFLLARTALTSATINQVLTRYSYAARAVEFERVAAIRAVPTN